MSFSMMLHDTPVTSTDLALILNTDASPDSPPINPTREKDQAAEITILLGEYTCFRSISVRY